MDYKHAAQQVLDCIGGKDNILSAAHCATRLRLVIADNAKVNKQELENAEGAKGVFEAQGQLQTPTNNVVLPPEGREEGMQRNRGREGVDEDERDRKRT